MMLVEKHNWLCTKEDGDVFFYAKHVHKLLSLLRKMLVGFVKEKVVLAK